MADLKIDWNSDDVARTKEFLSSPVGVKFIGILKAMRPSLLDGSDTGRALVRSGEVSGYERVFSMVDLVLSPEFKDDLKVQETYPDLDDDSKWR